MFFGGQTVTLGNLISDIGKVSIVVLMGLSCHDLNDSRIRKPAVKNPKVTTVIQNSLQPFLEVEMWESPAIEEVSKNVLTYSMLACK